jgi:hypothetical protein
MESWTNIKDTDYVISSWGRVKHVNGKFLNPRKVKSCNGYEGYWNICLIINKKQCNRSIHTLMLNCFKSDHAPSYTEILNNKKTGRPSKSRVKASTYIVKKVKQVEFIDGNRNNLWLDNLKFRDSDIKRRFKHAYNPKYANVFYTGDTLINLINKNTTSKFKKDNDAVIAHLKGNSDPLWKVMNDYESQYISALNNVLLKSTKGPKRKENALSKHDFVIDAQVKILNKVTKGRYTGHNFKAWSKKVVEKYLVQYFFIQKKKSEWIKDKTQTFIG